MSSGFLYVKFRLPIFLLISAALQEELELPYEIKRYQRQLDMRAPKELLETSPCVYDRFFVSFHFPPYLRGLTLYLFVLVATPLDRI